MLETIGVSSLDELIAQTIPDDIRQHAPLDLGAALSETEALEKARQLAARNLVLTSLIGQGYYDTILPSVIQRSEERRVGKECGLLCRSRWSPYH